MPTGFEKTAYFQKFYASAGIVDQMLYLTTLPRGGSVAIGLARSTEQGTFTRAERELHAAAFPVLEACSEARRAKVLSTVHSLTVWRGGTLAAIHCVDGSTHWYEPEAAADAELPQHYRAALVRHMATVPGSIIGVLADAVLDTARKTGGGLNYRSAGQTCCG